MKCILIKLSLIIKSLNNRQIAYFQNECHQIFNWNVYECIKVTLNEQKHNKGIRFVHLLKTVMFLLQAEMFVNECSNEEGTKVSYLLDGS